MNVVRRGLWLAGAPARGVLVGMIRTYRATLGLFLGGQCRFHPTCSTYAELAVRRTGATRGSLLTVWRVLRCSPLTRGGIDWPPAGRPGSQYEGVIHRDTAPGPDVVRA